MAEKIQISFYLFKDSVKRMHRGKTHETKIDFDFLDKYLKKKKFKEQAIKADLSEDFDIKLYYKKATPTVKWKEFIGTVAADEEEILKNNKSVNESYIILLYSKDKGKYYATTGGYAHITVQEYATDDFGIEILSRIVKPEDKALRSTKERSLTGGIQGEVKFFRNDYNFYDNENFGNIYNELNALLDKDKLVKIFGFGKHELKSDSLCVAKNSFSIKKTITFEKALGIINTCEKLLSKKRLVEVNSVKKIGKLDVTLINNLDNILEDHIYKNYSNASDFFSVEISHKEFEKYFSANYTELKKGSALIYEFESPIRNIQEILDVVRDKKSDMTRADFNSFLLSARIKTYDTDGVWITDDILRNHFCSEITYNKKSYFLIEKDWYQIENSFIEKINEQSTHFITSYKYDGPKLTAWDKKYLTENDYNASFIGHANTLVFDKFTPQNIEACDILKWDKDNIYFYHVKKGFDNSMRDLCNQVYTASRRVLEDSRNSYEYLKSLYNSVKNSKGTSDYQKNARTQLSKFTELQFIKLFEGRQIVFVLSVLDTAKKKRSLEKDIAKFDSNIAKFTLNELSKNMRNLGVEFRISQILK